MSHSKPRLEDQLAQLMKVEVEAQCREVYGSWFSRNPRILLLIAGTYIVLALTFVILLVRVSTVLERPARSRRTVTANGAKKAKGRDHLLIVLGSGGHTAEMMSIQQNLGYEYILSRFGRRTWVVSSGDRFSAARAQEFEQLLEGAACQEAKKQDNVGDEGQRSGTYDIVTVHRARNIHQSIYTTPVTALRSLWECVMVLRGRHGDQRKSDGVPYPDLILTNGPGTAVVLLLASLLLLIFGYAPLDGQGCMRSVYIESWARVKTLSLSGKILHRCAVVNRFLVQWKGRHDVDLTGIGADGKGSARKTNSSDDNLLPSRSVEFVGTVVT